MSSTKEEKEEMKWVHLVLGIVFSLGLIAAIVLYCLYETWFHLAGLGISSFLLSLVCMDYMTYNAREKLKRAAEEERKEIKELEGKIKKIEEQENISPNMEQSEQSIEQLKGEIERLKGELDKLEKLPLADRIALIFPESVEILDRHEIRRALVISLTIVYMILLFKESQTVEYFTWVYLSVIAFYFGSRGLEKYAEIRKQLKRLRRKSDTSPNRAYLAPLPSVQICFSSSKCPTKLREITLLTLFQMNSIGLRSGA
jgi:hypothetical protein